MLDLKNSVPFRDRRFPWRVPAFCFALLFGVAVVRGINGWLAMGSAAAFAVWIGALIAVLFTKPHPHASRLRDQLLVTPKRRAVWGLAVVLCGPPLVITAAARVWVGFVPVAAFAAFWLALGRRSIRIVEGGFDEIGVTGNAVRVPWQTVERLRFDERQKQLMLVVSPGERDVPYPEEWDGVATFSAAALRGIREEVLRAAPRERAMIEQLAALGGSRT